jgi:hypothetical protein
MGNQILRELVGQSYAMDGALSAIIDFSIYSMMMIHVPANWQAADIAFQVASERDGTFRPLYDEDDVLVDISVTHSRSYTAPARLAPARFVKIWSQSALSGIDQPDVSLEVDLKA